MSIQQHLASITLAGQRPQSVATRGRILRHLAATLRPRTLEQATRGDLELFLARPLKPRSRKAYLAHLRGYYAWALDLELVPADPTVKIPSIRVPHGVPRPVQPSDIEVALRHADPRMRAWILLMALGGLRCCEVSVLQPADLIVSGTTPMLYLREMKGGGSGTVPAHPAVVEALAALRVDENGQWWTVSAHYIGQEVAAHMRGLGIDATAHQLRHAAGTAWYRVSGHDLLTTARLLRHVNVNTSQVYAHLDPTRPAEVVNLVPLPAA